MVLIKELEQKKNKNKVQNFFFTVIDKNYILRAFTLFKSIKLFLKRDKFFIVCLDIDSYEFFRKIKKEEKLHPIFLEKTEIGIIKKITKNRPYNEFCWTMKSISFDYFSKNFECKWMIYLDSDSMVFSSINNHLDDDYDLIITPHRSKNNYFKLIEEKVGKFNAGFIAIKNNYNGKKILNYWKKKCIESCITTPTANKYGDQKYFDEIEKKFKRVNNSPYIGINLAPWNLCDRKGIINFDEEIKVVFYHMQGLKIYNKNIYNIYSPNFKVSRKAYNIIYKPYLLLLKKSFSILKEYNLSFKQRNEFSINLKFIIKNFILKNCNVKII